MKKKLLMLFLLLYFLGPIVVKAASNGLSLNYGISSSSNDVYPNDTFTIYVSVSGANYNLASNTIYLEYDTSKFSFVSLSAPAPAQASDVTYSDNGGRVIMIYVDNLGGQRALPSGTIAMFTFRALNNIGSGSFNFSVNGPGDSNGNSYNIAVGSGSLGVNVVARPVKSSNNYLSSLTVSGGNLNPGFNKDVTTYNVTVDAEAVTIDAKPEDGKAIISGTGYKTLKYGLNTFNITCTAENGHVKTYTVNITRPVNGSTNTALKSLSVSDTSISYNGSFYYTATVENSIKKVLINAVADDNKTTLTGTGMFNLGVGNNTFYLVATSESGVSSTYTIVINRKSKGFGHHDEPENPDNPPEEIETSNYLKSLQITGANFNFIKDKLTYLITVPYLQETLEINYELEDEKALVNINGDTKLKVGSNIVNIEVTDQKGNLNTYQILILRDDNTNALDNTKEEIIKALEENDEVSINESINTNRLLEKEILEKLKNENKTLKIKLLDENNNILDIIVIKGSDLENTDSIALNLLRDITDKKIIDNLHKDYVSINTKGSNIPNNTLVYHYVDSFNSKYVLVYLENGKLESKELEITDGYVMFNIQNNANYALVKLLSSENLDLPDEGEITLAPVKNPKKSHKMWFIIAGGTIVLALSLGGLLIALKRKKKKEHISKSDVDYLDLEPKPLTMAAPAIANKPVDTIPVMDSLSINSNTLTNEALVPVFPLNNNQVPFKEEPTGAVENYSYNWQKEYLSKKEQNINYQTNLDDPKYDIKPLLTADAIAATFVNLNLDFDFKPVNNNIDSLDLK